MSTEPSNELSHRLSQSNATSADESNNELSSRDRGLAMARQLAEQARGATQSFLPYLWQRFQADGCTAIAAGLSYTSLLSMVPMLAIALAMFAAFPAFAGLRGELIGVLASNLAPDLADTATVYLQGFVEKAGQASAAGIIGIVVTAFLLINNIQVAFDRVWGVTSQKNRLYRFPIYWVLLTLGPILFGASLSISTYVFSMAGSADFYGLSTGVKVLTGFLPFLFEAVGFSLFYRLMPTRPVRLRDAVSGALIAALLFEILKGSFGLYLRHFGGYQVVYGALATIPIFLVWTYLVWVTVLIGAEIAAALPEWRSGRRSVGAMARRSDLLSLALGTLAELAKAQSHGAGHRIDQLITILAADPNRMLGVLDSLKAARLVARSDTNRWILARDLNTYSLFDLCHELGIALGDADEEIVPLVKPLMDQIAADEKAALGESVASALKRIGVL
jgi:membrane protein